MNITSESTLDSIINKVKLESKDIFLVIFLVFISNLKQSNNIFELLCGGFFVEGTTN